MIMYVRLTKHCKKLGIKHKLIPPRTPWHNGKVERSHRNDQRYFYDLETFKNIDDLAETAADLCVKLAKGEDTGVTAAVSDGTYDVPSYRLSPVFVDRKNIDRVIIDGGFHTKEEVYLNKKAN